MVAKKIIIPSAKFSMIYCSKNFGDFCDGVDCKDCVLGKTSGDCHKIYEVIKENLVVIEEVLED